MANPKYSPQQKILMIESYMKETGTKTKLVAAEIAEWYNKKYNPYKRLNYQDFTRCDETKRYLEEINKRIENTIFNLDGTSDIIPERLIDIDHFLDSYTTRSKKMKYLQGVNERFEEVIQVNHKLALTNSSNKARIEQLEMDVKIFQDVANQAKLQFDTERKALKKIEKKDKQMISELNKITCKLLAYINRYMDDPIVMAHFVNDIKFLRTIDNEPVILPDSVKEIAYGNNMLKEVLENYGGWMESIDETFVESEDVLEDEPNVEESECLTVYTEVENSILKQLEELKKV